MKDEFNTPYEISNAIVERNDLSNYNILTAIEKLDKIRCRHLHLRFYSKVSISSLYDFIKHINELNFFSFELLIQNDSSVCASEISSLSPKLRTLYVSNANENKFLEAKSGFGNIVYTSKNIESNNSCGVINPIYFTTSVNNYTLNKSYNSCLFGKISIDVNGDVLNCPSIPLKFGNIENDIHLNILSHKSFHRFQKIKKDEILVCQDCEFRYVCSDCRAFVADQNNIYSKPLKCNYNPYTAEWEKK